MTETNAATCDPGDWGVTNPSYTTADHTYTLDIPCFDSNSEKWNVFLKTVGTTVGIVRKCPSHPPNLVCLGGVPGLTKAQAQTMLAIYPAGPITLADVQGNPGQANWACDDCTARHEEAHMNIDWLQDSLKPELNTFSAFLQNNGVAVKCSDASTLNCSSAISASVKATYDNEWLVRVSAALTTWDGQPEGLNGYNAEVPCYQAIRNALVLRASQP